MLTVGQFAEFCVEQHDVVCNQKYDGVLPYSTHIYFVISQAQKFISLVHFKDKESVKKAVSGHDLIEDARVSYSDIEKMVGKEVADIIYLCTENKGRNRAERKDEEWYKQLNTNKLAVFVKLCDIIANTIYSILTNSSMFEKYKEEYQKKVRPFLYCEEYKEMFNYLDHLYNLS